VNLLHAYAVEDPGMEYCQGMNFIAGFLYLVTKSEAQSFALFKNMLKKYEMTDLMNTETPKLKLSFYRLDRLISICLPEMHQHFKEENISSALFSTSFFITLFSQVLQT